MIKSPPHISDIQPYIPGKPIEELERELGITDSIKLASNENPVGPSPLALQAVMNGVNQANSSNSLNRYPDGSGYRLKRALSEKLGISGEEIIEF